MATLAAPGIQMNKRAKARGKPIKGARRKTPEPKHGSKRAALPSNASAAVVLTEVARLTRELREASEQQAATSEVLQLISSAPGDLQATFSNILEKAVGICDAGFGNIYRWDGTALRLMASHNAPPAYIEERRRSPLIPSPHDPVGRMLRIRDPIHVADAAAEKGYLEQTNPGLRAAVDVGGIRTFLAVPMLKDNELIGAFVLSRQQVRPFTNRQIEFVKNFAAQAVIAIENARLLKELGQSLEQQTATSEVLQIISRSQGDLNPVFESVLENGTRLCEAKFGNLFLRNENGFRFVAMHGVPSAHIEWSKREPQFVLNEHPNWPLAQMVRTNAVVHTADLALEASYAELPPVAVATFRRFSSAAAW
jgi:hypothetical protein